MESVFQANCFSLLWLRFWLKIFRFPFQTDAQEISANNYQDRWPSHAHVRRNLDDCIFDVRLYFWCSLFHWFICTLIQNFTSQIVFLNLKCFWCHICFVFFWQRREEGLSVMLIYWQAYRVTSIFLIVCKMTMFRCSQLHQKLRRKMGSQEHVPIQTAKAFLKRYSNTLPLNNFIHRSNSCPRFKDFCTVKIHLLCSKRALDS